MDEVLGIVIATGAMFVGLWVIGWAYGDFRKGPAQPPKDGSGQAPT